MRDDRRAPVWPLVVIGVLILGFVLVGGGGLYWYLASAREARELEEFESFESVPGWGDVKTGSAPGNSADVDPGMKIQVEGVTRNADGSYTILASASYAQSIELRQFHFFDTRVVNGNFPNCSESAPSGPPFRNPMDLTIRTPPLPAELRELEVHYTRHVVAGPVGKPEQWTEWAGNFILEVKLPPGDSKPANRPAVAIPNGE